MYARIAGVGSYLPSKRVTNFDLEQVLDTTDTWITERTGIKARHVAAPHEGVSLLAKVAAQRALDAARMMPNDVDLIILSTSIPENFFPSSACLLQSLLEITRPIPTFDLSAACAGFIYALITAEQFIKAGTYKTVLVVGSEIASRSVDWSHRNTAILFGDGAGAVVLTKSDEPGMITSKLYSQSQYKDLLYFKNPQAEASPECKTLERTYLTMCGNEVFRIAVKSLGDIVEEIVGLSGIAKKDIQWLVPHQANIRIIEAIASRLDFSMEKVILTIAEQGNTSSASIPLALDAGIRDGRIQRGDHLLIEGFGGGFVWGASLIRY